MLSVSAGSTSIDCAPLCACVVRHNESMDFFTHEELHHILDLARRVKLRHKLFTYVEFDWEINPTFATLMLVVRALVPNRDAPSTVRYGSPHRYHPMSGLDEERRHEERMQARHTREHEYHPSTLIPVMARIPIRLDREMLRDERYALDLLANETRRNVMNMLAHELDEMLEVDDRRVTDPHANDPDRYTMKYEKNETMKGMIDKLTISGKVVV